MHKITVCGPDGVTATHECENFTLVLDGETIISSDVDVLRRLSDENLIGSITVDQSVPPEAKEEIKGIVSSRNKNRRKPTQEEKEALKNKLRGRSGNA